MKYETSLSRDQMDQEDCNIQSIPLIVESETIMLDTSRKRKSCNCNYYSAKIIQLEEENKILKENQEKQNTMFNEIIAETNR